MEHQTKSTGNLRNLLLGDLIFILFVILLLFMTYVPVNFISKIWDISVPFSLFIAPLFFYLSLCLLAKILPKPKPGIYALKDPMVIKWFFQFIFARIWNYEIIRYPIFSIVSLRWFFLKCLGANIKLDVMMSSDAKLYDPYLISIDSGATIGMQTTIVPHFIVNQKLYLLPIHIGKNTLIGAGTDIAAGSQIGNDVMIQIHVLLLPNSIIPDKCEIGHSAVISKKASISVGKKIPPYAQY